MRKFMQRDKQLSVSSVLAQKGLNLFSTGEVCKLA